MAFYEWSQTAASNATADSAINWAEGQAPSSVNDSARSMMAVLRKWGDDIAGAIATGGTSTAYTVTTNQVFDSLAHLNGQVVAFTPHTTNGASPTLNVDGLGAKSIRAKSGVDLQSGVLIQGTPYVVLYNSSDAVFYLFGVGPDPGLPLGSSIDYWGTSAPTTHFALAYGQAVSRTTYATLFSLLSTTYGSGDGSTTFNLPDLRGRVTAGKDDMGGSAASRLTNTGITTGGATTLGGSGGGETKTLVTANLPAYTPSGSVTITSVGMKYPVRGFTNAGASDLNALSLGSTSGGVAGDLSATFVSGAASFSGTAQGGTSTAFAILQPTIIANKLIRII